MSGQFNVTVGMALRKARQAKGWTQAKLAEEAGITPNYVARIERGEMGPSLFVATKLSRALGVPLRTFVTEAA